MQTMTFSRQHKPINKRSSSQIKRYFLLHGGILSKMAFSNIDRDMLPVAHRILYTASASTNDNFTNAFLTTIALSGVTKSATRRDLSVSMKIGHHSEPLETAIQNTLASGATLSGGHTTLKSPNVDGCSPFSSCLAGITESQEELALFCLGCIRRRNQFMLRLLRIGIRSV